ncbi:MAG: heavy-metal-associated domain-containing protein [Clostridiales bacterium]|nr:heavy-metal-associated domain-containing protein [Clostridiales bacterium]
MTKRTYQLETVSCPSCIAKIEGMLKRTQGVEEAEVLFNTSRVKATLNEDVVSWESVRDKIQQLGYKVLSVK